jgi:transposase
MVKVLVAQLRTMLAAIAGMTGISAHVGRMMRIVCFVAGAGPLCMRRACSAALGTDRSRWQSADELLRFTGIAPAIERSGKQEWIRWRYFCPKFLRQSFHEYAAESVHHSFWARAYYNLQRLKGKGHHAAVRALAFKWIRIIWKCWQTRTTYNEVIYLESLRKTSSPLLKFIASQS